MPTRRFLCFCLLAGLALACSKPRPVVGLTYTLLEGEKNIDFQANPGWQPAWSDSLIARLERGALPAFGRDDQPRPARLLRPERRFRGLVLAPDTSGQLAEGGQLLHLPREVQAVLPAGRHAGQLDLYFYDEAVRLYSFYARVRQADVEALTGRTLRFVPADSAQRPASGPLR